MDHPLKQISWQVALLKESKGFGSPTRDETGSGHTERGRERWGEGREGGAWSFTIRLGCEKSLENGQEMGHPVSDVRSSAGW